MTKEKILMQRFKGVIPPVVTAFDSNRKLDLERTKEFIRHLIGKGRRNEYGAMRVTQVKRPRELEKESAQLRRPVSDLTPGNGLFVTGQSALFQA